MDFEELDLDQRRETVNSRQRFEAWREAYARARDFRGSMTWSSTKGREYLLRSSYDRQGRRRQVSLGPRTADTEAIKASFETGRTKATSRLDSLRETMIRQAAINRALGLGRNPASIFSVPMRDPAHETCGRRGVSSRADVERNRS